MQYKKSLAVTALASTLALGGCGASNTTKGAAIGAGAGGVVGGAIGHKAGNTAVGVLAGAAIGGVVGAVIGRDMDKQAKEIEEEVDGADVTRVEEGVVVTFDSGILFDVNSAALTGESAANVDKLAGILKRYEKTDILIVGHTDNRGSHDYNMELSEKRATSVQEELVSQGISADRVKEKGLGETEPVDEGDTDEAHRANRRVEVVIVASEEMKEAARAEAEAAN